MVGHLLQHHSAVDVSVVGVRVTEESSYHANLVSVFPGGAKRKRRVSGVLQRMYVCIMTSLHSFVLLRGEVGLRVLLQGVLPGGEQKD